MNETQIIERVPLIPYDQAPKISQPGEQTLNFPSPPVPAQRAAILGLGTDAIAAMGRDHLDAQLAKSCVQRISIVRPVPNEALGQLVYEPGVESRSDKGHLVRRSRGGTDGER